MSISWPAPPFPQYFQNTPQIIYPQMSEFNAMQVGPPKGRATDTVTSAVYTGTFLLTTLAEVATWRTFFEQTTSMGTAPFLFNDPITGTPTFYVLNPNAAQVGTTMGLTHLGGTVFQLAVTMQEAIPA